MDFEPPLVESLNVLMDEVYPGALTQPPTLPLIPFIVITIPLAEIPAVTLNGSIVSAMSFSYIYTGNALIITLYVVLAVVGVTSNLNSALAPPPIFVVYAPRVMPLRITPY